MTSILPSDYVAVAADYLLLHRNDDSFELYREAGEELERLKTRLQIIGAVDAWREQRRVA